MGRNGWALAVAGLGSCLVIAAACAGGDTPPRTEELEQSICNTYETDCAVGAAGSTSMGMGGSGTGGSTSGTGGSASGTGGSASGGASGSGTAGSGTSGSGTVVSGDICDAPTQVFSQKCSFQPCHGDGSANGAFADSESAAKALLDKATKNTQCGKYIDSSDPDKSALFTKLGSPPCGGSQMPLGSKPLEQVDIDCVQSWLSQF